VATHAEAVMVFLGPVMVDVIVGQTVYMSAIDERTRWRLTTFTVEVTTTWLAHDADAVDRVLTSSLGLAVGDFTSVLLPTQLADARASDQGLGWTHLVMVSVTVGKWE
jgi:hypothetical protein